MKLPLYKAEIQAQKIREISERSAKNITILLPIGLYSEWCYWISYAELDEDFERILKEDIKKIKENRIPCE